MLPRMVDGTHSCEVYFLLQHTSELDTMFRESLDPAGGTKEKPAPHDHYSYISTRCLGGCIESRKL